MIMDELSVDQGEFTVGETVKIGYVDQTHKDIHPEKTVFEVVSNGLEYVEIGNQKINSRAYLSKFNFNGSDQNKKVGVLSGGVDIRQLAPAWRIVRTLSQVKRRPSMIRPTMSVGKRSMLRANRANKCRPATMLFPAASLLPPNPSCTLAPLAPTCIRLVTA